jgi:hypothetical protein
MSAALCGRTMRLPSCTVQANPQLEQRRDSGDALGTVRTAALAARIMDLG